MHIFNKQIFGSDAVEWMNKSINEKVEWIKKHTNQQNDDIINEFLSNLSIYKDGDKNCLNCGNNANISKTNAVKTSKSSGLLVSKTKGKRNSKK